MPKIWRPCPNCDLYATSVRLYLRAPSGKGYAPIGWFCTHCGHSVLDQEITATLPEHPDYPKSEEVPT